MQTPFINFANKIKHHAAHWRDFVYDLIFPIECLGCGQEKKWLCRQCFKTIKFNHEHYCLLCKTKTEFGNFCQKCQEQMNLEGVWIAGDYQNKLLAEAIKVLKYKFAKDLSEELGFFLSIFLKNLLNKNLIMHSDIKNGLYWKTFDKAINAPKILLNINEVLIIPVPLHKKRRQWRGFNQSELLAKVICQNFKLKLSTDLKKIKPTTPQAKLNSAQRKTNLINCFAWTGDYLNEKNIILVDDVTTTGSTLNECAKVLKQNGAGEIWGLVIANG